MKIGIMGGTYNPPHTGHLHAASKVRRYLKLDRLILIPTSTPPHKKLPENTPSAAERLAMTKLAAESIGAAVSDIEIKKGGLSYTAETLEQIGHDAPGDALYFIIGTDMFLTIQNWYQPEDIFRAATLAVVARKRDDIARIREHEAYLADLGARVCIVPCEPLPISSTTLRERMGEESMKKFLPPGVWEYIEREKLYGVHA